jgi:hypothetical protein
MIKVHHLDVYLPTRRNKVRCVEEAQRKLIFFGDDISNVKDGIGVGFFVPT